MSRDRSVEPGSTARSVDPSAVLEGFARMLAAEEAALEPLGFEDLAAWVDGELDQSAEVLFEERLLRDPALREAAGDLRRLALALESEESPSAARVAVRGRPLPVRALAWLSAAAAAVIGALVFRPGFQFEPDASDIRTADLRPAERQPLSQAQLFSDGFEGGSPSGWSFALDDDDSMRKPVATHERAELATMSEQRPGS